MASNVKWSDVATSDVAIAGTSLNAIASGTSAANFVLGNIINNVPATMGALYGDFELNLSSAVTAGAGAPFLAVYLIPSLDGTNYATTNGGITAGPTSPNYLAGSILVPASVAVKVLLLRGIILPPSNFKLMINNQLGVALPAVNTNSARLYRYGEQAV